MPAAASKTASHIKTDGSVFQYLTFKHSIFSFEFGIVKPFGDPKKTGGATFHEGCPRCETDGVPCGLPLTAAYNCDVHGVFALADHERPVMRYEHGQAGTLTFDKDEFAFGLETKDAFISGGMQPAKDVQHLADILVRSYYTVPTKDSVEHYVMLSKMLRKTKSVVMGKFALRGPEFIGIIRPYANNTLLLQQIPFHTDVRESPLFDVPMIPESGYDLLATVLAIDPTPYAAMNDEYQIAKTQAINDKALEVLKQLPKTTKPAAKKAAATSNIMQTLEALRASVEQAKVKDSKKKRST